MDYSSADHIRPEFQVPPPPPTEHPDWTNQGGLEARTAEKFETDYLVRRPRTPLPVMSCVSDPVSGMQIAGVSNPMKLHRYLMSVYASRNSPLIRDCACFRQIEAMDLAISAPGLLINKPDSLPIEATAKFVGCSDRTLNSCDKRSMKEVSDCSCVSKTDASFRGQLSPPILNIERYLCLEGGHPLEISESAVQPFVSRVSKTSHSKGVQCSFVEWPRTISSRDHRRKRAIAPLPMIEEVDQLSSGEDSMESKKLNSLENKCMMMPVPAKPVQIASSSRSDSLLDVMHKRYCPNQYKKPESPRIFPRTSPGFQNRKTRTSPTRLTLIDSTANRLSVPSPTVTLTCELSSKSVLNLPFRCTPFANIPGSPSSLSSLESPLASPMSPPLNWNWIDQEPCQRCWTNAMPASEALSCSDLRSTFEGSPAILQKNYCPVCCKDKRINWKVSTVLNYFLLLFSNMILSKLFCLQISLIRKIVINHL